MEQRRWRLGMGCLLFFTTRTELSVADLFVGLGVTFSACFSCLLLESHSRVVSFYAAFALFRNKHRISSLPSPKISSHQRMPEGIQHPSDTEEISASQGTDFLFPCVNTFSGHRAAKDLSCGIKGEDEWLSQLEGISNCAMYTACSSLASAVRCGDCCK